MNYFLNYSGDHPNYIKYSLNTILSIDKDANIYFSSDIPIRYKNITYLAFSDITSDKTKEIENIDIYKDTNYENNPLWKNSLMRIFYLSDMSEKLDIESFVHFDLDVLIYKPFSDIKNYFRKNKLNITPCTDNEIIFGYSYIDGLDNYKKITDSIFNYIVNQKSFRKEKLNEMKILSEICKNEPDLFNLLPILPSEEENNIFDPASYGQYLGGLDGKPRKLFSKPWAGDHHYVGKEILNRRIKVKFRNNQPVVIKKNKKFDLVNLHIHSKELHKFLPNQYKVYI